MIVILEIIAVLIFTALGGFFSGCETGVYRLSKVRMILAVEQKQPLFVILSKIMKDPHGLVFAILIGNNLVNYLATSVATLILLEAVSEDHAAFYATLIMTPVLFTFSEVIPKNLFYYKSDRLMPRFAPLLWFFNKVFTLCGAIAVLKFISNFFTKLFGSPDLSAEAVTASRQSQIKQIIHETKEEGILSTVQSNILNRLLRTPEISVFSVMTPIAKTEMVDVNSGRQAVLDVLKRSPYSRILVYESNRSNILGYIRIYDVLVPEKDFEDLREFVTPLKSLPPTKGVIEALNIMRKENLKIMLVTSRRRTSHRKQLRSMGIVTMKDLVEEITGELAQW